MVDASVHEQGGESYWQKGGLIVAVPGLIALVLFFSLLRFRESPEILGWRSHLGREQERVHEEIEQAHIELGRLALVRRRDRWRE